MGKHVVIYVTGLNDDKATFQKIAIKPWRIFGVTTVFFQTRWSDEVSFTDKLDRLLRVIDSEEKKGNKVTLVAVSAGASIAIAASAKREDILGGVVFVCGKLRRPEAVGEQYYTKNPAFRDAMRHLNENVDRVSKAQKSKMLTITPLFDETVVVKDAKIEGVKNVTLPTLFHVPTIALSISLFSACILLFLKYQERKEK